MTKLTAIDATNLAHITGGQMLKLSPAQQLASRAIEQRAKHNYPGSTVTMNHVGADRNGMTFASGSLYQQQGAELCSRSFDASYNAATGTANVNASSAICRLITR